MPLFVLVCVLVLMYSGVHECMCMSIYVCVCLCVCVCVWVCMCACMCVRMFMYVYVICLLMTPLIKAVEQKWICYLWFPDRFYLLSLFICLQHLQPDPLPALTYEQKIANVLEDVKQKTAVKEVSLSEVYDDPITYKEEFREANKLLKEVIFHLSFFLILSIFWLVGRMEFRINCQKLKIISLTTKSVVCRWYELTLKYRHNHQ